MENLQKSKVVRDPEKARAMAEAGNTDRTKAARLRDIFSAFGDSHVGEELDSKADIKEEEAAAKYDYDSTEFKEGEKSRIQKQIDSIKEASSKTGNTRVWIWMKDKGLYETSTRGNPMRIEEKGDGYNLEFDMGGRAGSGSHPRSIDVREIDRLEIPA